MTKQQDKFLKIVKDNVESFDWKIDGNAPHAIVANYDCKYLIEITKMHLVI